MASSTTLTQEVQDKKEHIKKFWRKAIMALEGQIKVEKIAEEPNLLENFHAALNKYELEKWTTLQDIYPRGRLFKQGGDDVRNFLNEVGARMGISKQYMLDVVYAGVKISYKEGGEQKQRDITMADITALKRAGRARVEARREKRRQARAAKKEESKKRKEKLTGESSAAGAQGAANVESADDGPISETDAE